MHVSLKGVIARQYKKKSKHLNRIAVLETIIVNIYVLCSVHVQIEFRLKNILTTIKTYFVPAYCRTQLTCNY